MVLKRLAGSGGIQVFPPVVALAQMCAGLCNCTPPLTAQSRWLHETRCEQIRQSKALWPKFPSLHTYIGYNSLIFQKILHTAWFFRRCSIFPTPHWSKWSCCRVFWQQQNELRSRVDEPILSGTSHWPRCRVAEDPAWASAFLQFTKCHEEGNNQHIKVRFSEEWRFEVVRLSPVTKCLQAGEELY